jgi:hypothetical protein
MLRIAIRIAAPYQRREHWGDFHFAESLGRAFARTGHPSTVRCRDQELEGSFDVVIVLRGLERFRPVEGAFNILWCISHPDLVDYEEFESFDLVLVASYSFAAMLQYVTNSPVFPLLQATDPERFHPIEAPTKLSEPARALLFVGNTRHVDRPAVRYAVAGGYPVEVYGSGWKGLIPDQAWKGSYLPNDEVGAAYAAAAAVLNDHWESMQDFGFVSNRIFDSLAAGAKVITDTFPALDRLFGDRVLTFDDQPSFDRAAAAATSIAVAPPDHHPAAEVLAHHTFDHRADQILGLASGRLQGVHRAPYRIGLIPALAAGGWAAATYRRLVQPLTSDLPVEVELQPVDPERLIDPHDLDGLEAIVVSAGAALSAKAVDELGDLAFRAGVKLVADIDHRRPTPATDVLVASVDLVLVPDQSAASAGARVLAPGVDPRLWRRYEKEGPVARSGLSILWLSDAGEPPDLDDLEVRLGDVAGLGGIQVSVAGAHPAPQPWLRLLGFPPRPTYPYWARWLRSQAAEFDLAVVPPAVGNGEVLAMECAAMGIPCLALPGTAWATFDAAEQWGEVVARCREPAELENARLRVREDQERLWRQRSARVAGEQMVSLLREL